MLLRILRDGNSEECVFLHTRTLMIEISMTRKQHIHYRSAEKSHHVKEMVSISQSPVKDILLTVLVVLTFEF